MALVGPNKEDVQKIHSEVNQIVNQRLAITTLAITIFGVMVALILRSKNSFPNNVIDDSTFLISHLLMIVLFALYILTQHLSSMLRIFTTYLSVSKVSNWEIDWKKYRNKYAYLGYTKPLSIIFIVLGLISLFIPFFFLDVYRLKFESRIGMILSLILGITYVVLIFGIGIFGWFAKEGNYLKRWEELNEEE